MEQWLERALTRARTDLPGSVGGYLLGRGVQEQAIPALGLGVWHCPEVVVPCVGFRKRYGPHGEALRGGLVAPLRSGRGTLLGFEGRAIEGAKRVSQYKLPRAGWNAVFLGLDRAMPKIWAGGQIWIGEGLFDMTALDHIVPESDATLGALTARLSDQQIEFLRRYARSMVNMVFDLDEKGRKATHGWVDERTGKERWGVLKSLDRVGVVCRDIPYRGGKDPGEIWEQHGTDGLRRAFSSVCIRSQHG